MESGASRESASGSAEGPPSRSVLLAAFVAGALLLAFLTWRLELVFDDAFISFRYSKHLANGEGLCFNLGVHPPVEGYSNLLWVLWCALPELLGWSTPRWALASNLLCAFALLGLVLSFVARRLRPSPLALFACSLFLATLPSMAVYATGGLETMAFALALFAVFERLAGGPERPRVLGASLAALAAVLLRPDGVLWVGVLALLALVRAAKSHDPRLRRAALQVAALGLAAFLAQTAWRFGYHGDWLPNTVRAKASMSAMTLERGGKYARSYLVHYPTVGLVLLLALALLRSARRALVAESLLFVAAVFAYVVAVGGDFLPMGRFLLPAVPFVAILFTLLAERCLSAARPLALVGLPIFLALSALPHLDRYLAPESLRAATHYNWNFPTYLSELELLDGERRRSEDLAELGRALAVHTRPEASFVIGTIGAAGYYSDRFLFDQFGLVNREVAALPAHGRRTAAGHDHYAPATFFAKDVPTYTHVALIDVDDDGSPIEATGKLFGRARRVVIPLEREDGSRTGRALLLVESD